MNFQQMESMQIRDPKDEKITNQDDSVTNKDGNNNLEKGKQPAEQKNVDGPQIKTVTPDNDNGDPGPPVKADK